MRFVWRRDGGRCQTPGCRSTVGIEIHHDQHRAHGGSHDPSNLRLQCSACHLALHLGTLVIERTAAGELVARRRECRDSTPGAHASAVIDLAAGAVVEPAARAYGEVPAVDLPARAVLDDPAPNPAVATVATKLDMAVATAQARDALVGLGWKPAIARAAVAEAQSHVGPGVGLAVLIREALRRCPKPTS